jgi:hypothetical protein
MIQIHPRHRVATAYRRALELGATHQEAIASAAQALSLAPEAVQAAVEDHGTECAAS